jgi:hypothetical protein
MKHSFWIILQCLALWGESQVELRLAPYKELLAWGTYEGSDWSKLPRTPKSRYETFKAAFERLERIDRPVIVELGTSRSFNHGGLTGCNSNDVSYWMPNAPETWDWGAGFFTRMAAVALQDHPIAIYTVDLAPDHIGRCKKMTSDFQNIHYVVSDSVSFLKKCSFPNGIHLLYLDTGDMTPLEPTALLQLEEAKVVIARNLIAPDGYILIDDIQNQTPKKFGEISDLGKGKYSIPFLLKHGFEIVMDEYQILLRKSK